MARPRPTPGPTPNPRERNPYQEEPEDEGSDFFEEFQQFQKQFAQGEDEGGGIIAQGSLPPEIQAMLQGSAQEEQDPVEQHVRGFLTPYESEPTSWERRALFGGWPVEESTAPRYDEAKLKSLQERLWRAGLLSNAAYQNLKHYDMLGTMDGETMSAVENLVVLADENEMDPDTFLSRRERVGGPPVPKFVPPAFEKPAFNPVSEEDVEDSIEDKFQEVLGRLPQADELMATKAAWRSLERDQYAQAVASARSVHGQRTARQRQAHQAQHGMGGPPGPATIEQPPVRRIADPGTFTEERFEDTDEAKAFHGARLGLDLINALKGGF